MKEICSVKGFELNTLKLLRLCVSLLGVSVACGLGAQAVAQTASPSVSIPAPVTSRPVVPAPAVSAPLIPAAVTPRESSAAVNSDEGTRTIKQTLRQLGANSALALRGADGRDGVRFNVRADEVISKATLTLSYGFSPALLNDGSQLNVLINGDVAASLPIDRADSGKNLERTLELPVRLISDYNQLTLQLIGRTTLQCEDPTNNGLWATVSNKSTLELVTQAIALPNDLSLLPLPFMDQRDARSLSLPFVFVGALDNAMLEASGTLSSWFGALASGRGARFPVTLNTLPAKGNAVVLVANARPALSGVQIAAISGPTISVVTNPTDPFGKLLLVMGRDSTELKKAASALALGGSVLSGQTAAITGLTDLAARRPYDAPNWLPSDRAVKFGELSSAQTLNVTGYDPGAIRLNVRVPPDLYSAKTAGVPIDLKYRYTPQPTSKNSSLTISLNDQLLKSFILFPLERLTLDDSLYGKVRSRVWGEGTALEKLQADETQSMAGKLTVPLTALYPRSQLQLRYQYDFIKTGECGDIIVDNMRGAIEPSSTLDISGFSHFMAMPDLRAFHTLGFPFTRLADLSQTAVVLPDSPSLQEYSTYLELLGRLGESTGYPGTAITVTQAERIATVADKDLLLIASGSNQPLLKQWASALPGSLGGAKRLSLSDLMYEARQFVSPDSAANLRQARSELTFSSVADGALFAGFESPLKGGRSAVLVWGVEAQGLRDGISALIGGEGYDKQLEGSLALVRAQKIESLVAEQSYHIGRLGWFEQTQWTLSRSLSLFSLTALIAALLLAIVAFVFLRSLAKRRLAVADGVKRGSRT
ncbi:MAG: cellulose biosynthesis cyclic di-GMP-binding regulatory protein BcsB [Alcaligenaceae bacterium]|nr:cellulose biosynthesis cyclic di-GMP-binding regulatory protein BcsB [Alcaligenaceae bacterium]